MMKIDRNHIRGLIKSFFFAFRGLWLCIKNERNMRIHMLVSASVIVFAGIYGLEPVQFAILIIAMGFVIVCEMLNTSIEALVDLETPAYHSLARIAKDVAAGAVLVSSITAVCVGIALFFNLKLWETLLIILSSPVYLVVFAVLITFGTVFVFKGTEMFKSKKK